MKSIPDDNHGYRRQSRTLFKKNFQARFILEEFEAPAEMLVT
jgi:hypothetical protein